MNDILNGKGLEFKSIIEYPDIHIKPLKAVFIEGESGCGKSTLLKMFNGTQSPRCGKLYYDGHDIEKMDTVGLRRKVLLVGQSVYLFPGTIRDNFNEFYRYRDMTPPSDEEIEKYLSLCCIDSFGLDDSCDNMSGGERQRVYMAVFISLSPKVLMLDEPTSALDEATSHKFMNNVKNFCKEKGMTLIVISHNKKLTEEFADEVITLGKEGIS